jgi:hypothetical protein
LAFTWLAELSSFDSGSDGMPNQAPLTLVPTPSSPGNKSATVEIQSHDPDESPFTLSLGGRQATATDLWRQSHFGGMDETGPASDQSDPDADGIPDLVKFALGSHPKVPTPAPGTLVRNGSTLEVTHWRSKAALGEIAFVRNFSQSLADGWSKVGGMVETILEETTARTKRQTFSRTPSRHSSTGTLHFPRVESLHLINPSEGIQPRRRLTDRMIEYTISHVCAFRPAASNALHSPDRSRDGA